MKKFNKFNLVEQTLNSEFYFFLMNSSISALISKISSISECTCNIAKLNIIEYTNMNEYERLLITKCARKTID